MPLACPSADGVSIGIWRVEGEIRLHEGVLTLSPGSEVIGDVTVPSVVVHGSVEGNMKAAERVEVRPTASVKGSLAALRLAVAEGAQLNCRVEMPALARPQLVQSANAAPPMRVAV
jgi:cytoskeletal protein CcmA (bactofilin family)